MARQRGGRHTWRSAAGTVAPLRSTASTAAAPAVGTASTSAAERRAVASFIMVRSGREAEESAGRPYLCDGERGKLWAVNSASMCAQRNCCEPRLRTSVVFLSSFMSCEHLWCFCPPLCRSTELR